MVDVAIKPLPRTVFIGLGAYGAHGGIQRFNRRVVDALGQLGVPGLVIMMADQPSDVAMARPALVTHACGGSRLRFLSRFWLSALRADVLLVGHINLLPFAILFRLMRPRARVVLFAHGVEVWGNPEFRTMKSWEPIALRRVVGRIAVVSRYSRNEMMRVFRQEQRKFEDFPNAADVVPLIPSGCSNIPTILCVSRLDESEREKNVDKVILAMPKILESVPGAKLNIIGKGRLTEELRSLAARIGVGDHVAFLGSVDDAQLSKAYAEAVVFALPSSKEGFGIVYLEAWLRGLPVIGSIHGAAAEVIDDNRDGLLVEPTDIGALADALVHLISNPNLAKTMAAAGREKVVNKYSGEVFVKNVRDIITIPLS